MSGLSKLSRTVSPVDSAVLQEIIADGRFCYVSRKVKNPNSRADNDRQTSVVEPDIQAV